MWRALHELHGSQLRLPLPRCQSRQQRLMVERYLEVTCDVCGDPEFTSAGETLGEFFSADRRPRWRRRGRLAICAGCWEDGRRWGDASLFSGTPPEPA